MPTIKTPERLGPVAILKRLRDGRSMPPTGHVSTSAMTSIMNLCMRDNAVDRHTLNQRRAEQQAAWNAGVWMIGRDYDVIRNHVSTRYGGQFPKYDGDISAVWVVDAGCSTPSHLDDERYAHYWVVEVSDDDTIIRVMRPGNMPLP